MKKYLVLKGWITFCDNMWYKTGDIIVTNKDMSKKIKNKIVKEVE